MQTHPEQTTGVFSTQMTSTIHRPHLGEPLPDAEAAAAVRAARASSASSASLAWMSAT